MTAIFLQQNRFPEAFGLSLYLNEMILLWTISSRPAAAPACPSCLPSV